MEFHVVAVKCVVYVKNTDGEGSLWDMTDAHARKRGGANRIRYPVVHALNDVY